MSDNSDRYRSPSTMRRAILLEAGASVVKGDLVMALPSGYGYAGAVDDSDPETTGAKLFGVALDDVDNTDGSAGDLSVLCDVGGCEVKVTHTAGSQAQTNVGDPVFVDGARAVDLTGGMTDQVRAGTIIEIVSATEVWVATCPFGVAS